MINNTIKNRIVFLGVLALALILVICFVNRSLWTGGEYNRFGQIQCKYIDEYGFECDKSNPDQMVEYKIVNFNKIYYRRSVIVIGGGVTYWPFYVKWSSDDIPLMLSLDFGNYSKFD